MITLVPRRRTRRVLCYGTAILLFIITIVDFLNFFMSSGDNGHHTTKKKPLQEVLPSLYISIYRSQTSSTISKEWRLSLVNLVQYLGVEKTFVSLVEEKREGDVTDARAERDIEMLSSDFTPIGGQLDIKRVEPWRNNFLEITTLSLRERDLAVQASKAAWEVNNRNMALETMMEFAL